MHFFCMWCRLPLNQIKEKVEWYARRSFPQGVAA
uniref:Uncharacterized protein n=1 Tax=Manihot esculenta TaxID=3983 RepID=A0A2C9U0Q3_MANES